VMLNKAVLGFGVIALGAIGGGFYFYTPSTIVEENQTMNSEKPNTPIKSEVHSHLKQADDRILRDQQAIGVLIDKLEKIHQQVNADEAKWSKQTTQANQFSENSAQIVDQPLFQRIEKRPHELNKYGKQYIDDLSPQAIISLGDNWLNNIQTGKEFLLPDVKNDHKEKDIESAYTAKITHKVPLWNGDYLIKALIYTDAAKTEKQALPLIMSVGEQMTYMSYSTEKGSYEAELKNGLGEIYAVNDMDRVMENGKHDDVIYPNIRRN